MPNKAVAKKTGVSRTPAAKSAARTSVRKGEAPKADTARSEQRKASGGKAVTKETRKVEAKKVEAKKPEPPRKSAQIHKLEPKNAPPRKPEAKKAEPKKPELKKAEPKKPEPKKAEARKPEPKKVEAARPEPVVEPAKPDARKPEIKAEVKKLEPRKLDFQPTDFVVYPTHGVGKILRVEKTEISGTKLELFVIEFEKDKMILRVPIGKAQSVGMRKLSSPQKMKTALLTLKGRARIKRAMWSRRAQEYEAKINSGDPIAIAEVVRDLHRNAGQPDQSYSERQIYEAARDRLVRELAAVERIDEEQATERLEKMLRAA